MEELSGAPLTSSSTQVLKVRSLMGEDFPIIASGGVMTVEDYENKSNQVQLWFKFMSFIYSGPN